MASYLLAMACNLIGMASNLLAMACNLTAMASNLLNLIAMASNLGGIKVSLQVFSEVALFVEEAVPLVISMLTVPRPERSGMGPRGA